MTGPAEQLAAVRMLDANFNRASEGLRVVEDYCRFALGDEFLTRHCKRLRHGLTAAIETVCPAALAAARESQADVGAAVKTPAEGERHSLAHIATASWQRVQQALRVIEETLKLREPGAAAKVESLRYESYTLDKACRIGALSRERLAAARLYVLVAGGSSECAFVERVQELIAAGAQVIQLREKRLGDRALLARARLLRRIIDEQGTKARQEPRSPTDVPAHRLTAGPLFIVNDRPDLAVLARADGVHVGQEDPSVHDVRQIVGPDMLVGVSTHNIEQARQAVLDGANYIGCGPTFPSNTKEFAHFPGLTFLREVAAEISLPAFAIGGITSENLPQVAKAGFQRVAVGSAISNQNDAARAAAKLLAALQSQS